MIQQNINQIISLTGLLMSQTPAAKARTEAIGKKQAATAEYKTVKKEWEDINTELLERANEEGWTEQELDLAWEKAGQQERMDKMNLYELRYKSSMGASNIVDEVSLQLEKMAEEAARGKAEKEATAAQEVATEEITETPVETAAAPIESPKKQPSLALRKIQEPLNRLIEEQTALRAARDPYSGKINARPYGGQIVYRR